MANTSRNQIWTTADGTKVKIKDMTDDHLRNVVRYIERASIKYLLVLRNMVPFDIEDGMNDVSLERVASKLSPLYDSMLQELGKRNLTKKSLVGLDPYDRIVVKKNPKPTNKKPKKRWKIKEKGRI